MCTVFKFKSEKDASVIVGKNYDVKGDYKGMLFINRTNIKKTAYLNQDERPVEWISKYGSVTFSQISKEFPTSGMNEQGLVVEQNTLWNTMYPDRDDRPAIKELQWMQYMLDTCKTVEEVIQASQKVRISQNFANIMFYVCDKTGNYCVIQFILGEEQVINDSKLKYGVLTNDGYDTCLLYLEQHKGYGKGNKKIRNSNMSIDRFVVTVDAVQHLEGTKDHKIQDYFNILDLTRYKDTKWQIVYEPVRGKIFYKSLRSEVIKEVDLKKIAYSKKTLVVSKNVDIEKEEFHPYNAKENYELLYYFFENFTFLSRIRKREEELKKLATYVDKLQMH